jgi:hypothetical protein
VSNDKAILAAAILPSCGRCRICSCRGDQCSLPEGGRCCWMDALRTLCSNPRCITAAALMQKRHREKIARAEARAASTPWWIRRMQKPTKKRRRKPTKGRAA